MRTDEQLMSIASDDRDSKNSKEAFACLFEKYHKPIIKYLWLSLSDFELAQDLSHDVFLKAYRSRKMYRDQYKFTTWLWTIAKRTLIDHTRKKRDLLFEDIEGQDIDQITDEANLGFDEVLINKIENEKLQECIKQLSDSQREVLSLRVFSEMKFSEIAEVLSLKENTVKSLAKRATSKLIELVKKSQMTEEISQKEEIEKKRQVLI